MTNATMVHTTEIVVRWCDMDAFGHVNNSVYFSYFEIARIDWWQTIMPDHTDFTDVGPVIVTAHCNFIKPALYPLTLLVKLSVGPAGRSSYECFYELVAKNNPALVYATGNTKVVWVDRHREKSIPLPDYMRKHLPAEIS